MNTVKTFLLMTSLALFMVIIGGLLGGPHGARGCFIVALPMPRVAIIPLATPNAFATGRNPKNAVIAITTGLSNLLTQDELEGVLAHELGHIRNRDILISTMAAALAGTISSLSQSAKQHVLLAGRKSRNPAVVLLIAMLAPVTALLIQVSISRNREFDADKAGAQISGKPLALVSALQKLEALRRSHPVAINPSTAHLFILNPLGRVEHLSGLFATHPSTNERSEKLQAMASNP